MSFDHSKNTRNLIKHGISLGRAIDFDFDAACIDIDDRQDYGETRYVAISFLDAQLYTLVFVLQTNGIRAISLRKSTREERKIYVNS